MDNKLKFQGTIVEVRDINIVSEKFRKQDIVVECDYPINNGRITHYFVVTAINMLTEISYNLKKGDKIEGEFRVKGNRFLIEEGKYKYSNHLDLMNVKKVE